MDRYSLGIDIGGTKANIGAFTHNGDLIHKHKYFIDKNKSCKETIKDICGVISSLLEDNGLLANQIHFTGVGLPGTVDSHSSMLMYAPNIFWRDEPIGDYFSQFAGLEVSLMQDARVAALGELLFGAGKGYRNIICLTLGTGVGSGIIINEKIYGGAFDTAGELGHIIVAKDGAECNCGKHGCLEAYASGRAIMKRASELFQNGEPIAAEQVFEKALQGDARFKDIIDEAVEYLSIGIANAINILSPETVIISGGMCEQDELIIRPLQKRVHELAYSLSVSNPRFKIIKASLGEDAPLYGAGMLYKGI